MVFSLLLVWKLVKLLEWEYWLTPCLVKMKTAELILQNRYHPGWCGRSIL